MAHRSGTPPPKSRSPPTSPPPLEGQPLVVRGAYRSYGIGRKLGSGAYGDVNLATDMRIPERVFAAKSVKKVGGRGSQITRGRDEANVLKSLNHPNIIRLHEVFDTPEAFYMILDFAPGGDLLARITTAGPVSEDHARVLFRQICAAVHFAHYRGYIHRDLKLENVLLMEDGDVRLADWGFAGPWRRGLMQDASYGSLHYASPEIISGTSYEGPEVDVWSLGVMLYGMLTGSFPFGGRERSEVADKILSGRFPMLAGFCPTLVDLLSWMLTVPRARRATMDDVIAHPWMAGLRVAPRRTSNNRRASSFDENRPISFEKAQSEPGTESEQPTESENDFHGNVARHLEKLVLQETPPPAPEAKPATRLSVKPPPENPVCRDDGGRNPGKLTRMFKKVFRAVRSPRSSRPSSPITVTASPPPAASK